MAEYCEIRATYDTDTITVYQAYNKAIAQAAAANKKFCEPFSFNRMTWIKPSFLWMMERSGWGKKANQEHILAVKITRSGFEAALQAAVLSHPHEKIYQDGAEWERQKREAGVTIQWDPERDIRGNKLEFRSIQMGISRKLIHTYNDEWIVDIEDITPLVHKIHALKVKGDISKAKSFLPKERIYPVPAEIARKIGVG